MEESEEKEKLERLTNAVLNYGLVDCSLTLGQEERLHDEEWHEICCKDEEADSSHSPWKGDFKDELSENNGINDGACDL